MTDPTPLHRLADHWRELADEYDDEAHLALHRCADQLAGSLAAIDVEAAAMDAIEQLQQVFDEQAWSASEEQIATEIFTAALQLAFAAGQAQGIAKCRMSGEEHRWASVFTRECADCGVFESAIEQASVNEEAK